MKSFLILIFFIMQACPSCLAADQEATGECHQGVAEAVRDLGCHCDQRRWECKHPLQRPGSRLCARAEGKAYKGREWREREKNRRSGTASPAGLLGSAEEHHPSVSARPCPKVFARSGLSPLLGAKATKFRERTGGWLDGKIHLYPVLCAQSLQSEGEMLSWGVSGG